MSARIIYGDWIIRPAEFAPTRFDLYRVITREKTKLTVGTLREKTGETYTEEEAYGYGMRLSHAIDVIVHKSILDKDVTLTLKEFVDQYKDALSIVEKAINQPQEA